MRLNVPALITVALPLFTAASPALANSPPGVFELVSEELIEHQGTVYRYQNLLDQQTLDMRRQFVDPRGRALAALPRSPQSPSVVSEAVQRIIDGRDISGTNGNTIHTVLISLRRTSTSESQVPGRHGEIDATTPLRRERLDGHPADGNRARNIATSAAQARAAETASRTAAAQEQLERLISDGLLPPQRIARLSDTTLVARLSASELTALSKAKDRVAEISEVPEATDAIDAALIESGVVPYAHELEDHDGDGIGVLQTELYCADPNVLSNYLRLSGRYSDHAARVGSILRSTAPNAFIYCQPGVGTLDDGTVVPQYPSAATLAGLEGRPSIEVVNGSFYWRRNPAFYDAQARDWDNLAYDHDLLVVFSAGNEGPSSSVQSPALASNVLAVGNYDSRTRLMSYYSSGGDPGDTRAIKPELSAPGVNITPDGFSFPQSGTSFSAPIVSGMAADLLESAPLLRDSAAALKATLLASTWRKINAPEATTGLGGLDYRGLVQGWHSWYWSDRPQRFPMLDARSDGRRDSWISVEQPLQVSHGTVRAVLTWLQDGDWLFENRESSQPVVANYDMRVLDPNGRYVAGAFRYRDQFEWLQFDPQMDGIYTLQVRQSDLNDRRSRMELGLSINFSP